MSVKVLMLFIWLCPSSVQKVCTARKCQNTLRNFFWFVFSRIWTNTEIYLARLTHDKSVNTTGSSYSNKGNNSFQFARKTAKVFSNDSPSETLFSTETSFSTNWFDILNKNTIVIEGTVNYYSLRRI